MMDRRQVRTGWRTLALLLAGGALLWAAGCASQQEQALSAMHYFQRGNAAFQAEDFERAVEHYRMALTFDPDAPDIHYNMGLAYYRIGAYEDAAAAYQDALRLDPKFAEAHLNLALAMNKLYNAGAAHQHYNRYRALIMGQAEGQAAAGSTGATASAATSPAANPAAKAAAGGPGGAPPATAAVQAAQQLRRESVAPPTPNALPAQPASNPFQGNSKWWTQDTANLNR